MQETYTVSNAIKAQISDWCNTASFSAKFISVSGSGDLVDININAALTAGEKTELDNYISSYVPSPLYGLPKNIAQKIEFSIDLIQRMKNKNISEGLSSLDQAAWIHHRLRKFDYTLSDSTTVVQVDLMNLVIAGDIETAEGCLGQFVPDDMTEAYHWLSADRITWIRNEIRTYMGWPLL